MMRSHCGARLASIDLNIPHCPTKEYPFITYETKRIKAGYASFKCMVCLRIFRQKLKVSKKRIELCAKSVLQ